MKGTVVSVLVGGFFVVSVLATRPVAAEGDAKAGAAVYTGQKCDKCHGEKGEGDGDTASKLKLKMHDWTAKDVMAKMTDQDLAAIIEQGGKAVGKAATMPAYGKKLDAAKINDLVAFIRSLAQ